MAELSGFWTTDNATPIGDQVASYTQSQLSNLLEVMAAAATFEGVAVNYLNELAVSDGGANTATVATGGAVVDGKAYYNDASLNVNIPSAVGGGNTRIDRIVVRASWAAFDTSITRIAGTDAASPTPPTIESTSETTYDIMLAQVLVDTSGNITVTDERVWARPPGMMMIPIIFTDTYSTAGDIRANAPSYLEVTPLPATSDQLTRFNLDKSKLPSAATVTLNVRGADDGSVRLYNNTTSAAVTGSEVSNTSSTVARVTSSDFYANLASGANEYYLQFKKDGLDPFYLNSAWLQVEW